MRPVLWLIGGTSEGRALIKELADYPIDLYVSVATDYGASLIEPQANVTIMAERMDLAAMRSFLREHKPAYTIDATHPYATIVTATVQEACKAEKCAYLRLVRPAAEGGDYITVADFQEAVELLNSVEGNIFLTTGSKNLPDFVGITNYAERIALRVLPMESSLKMATSLGYKNANIVCMQGPFAQDLDIATFKKFNSKYVVTKDSGKAGGFDEKVAAAKAVGAKLIVIGRASEERGEDYEGTVALLKSKLEQIIH